MQDEDQVPHHLTGGSLLDIEARPWPKRLIFAAVFAFYFFVWPHQGALEVPESPETFVEAYLPQVFLFVLIATFCVSVAIVVWDLFLNTAKLVRHGGSYWEKYWGLFLFDGLMLVWIFFALALKFGPLPVDTE